MCNVYIIEKVRFEYLSVTSMLFSPVGDWLHFVMCNIKKGFFCSPECEQEYRNLNDGGF